MDLDRVAAHTPRALAGTEREAAVLAPVILERDAVLFTERADHLADHPGQMSFPGGGREPEDADLLATALREAEEEVGMDPAAPDVVGRLDDIRTVSRYVVRPFVARVPAGDYRPTDEEVAQVARLPLDALTDPANYESEWRQHPEEGEVRLHFFHVDGFTVWGATARMLVQLLDIATDWTLPAAPERPEDVVSPGPRED